jgi:hypothetical protein
LSNRVPWYMRMFSLRCSGYWRMSCPSLPCAGTSGDWASWTRF